MRDSCLNFHYWRVGEPLEPLKAVFTGVGSVVMAAMPTEVLFCFHDGFTER